MTPEQQDTPGYENEMESQPRDEMRGYRGSGKLDGRVALVTGGDSGIGRATCVAFAKEGADVAIAYLDEHEDAKRTKELVEAEGRRAITLACDLRSEEECTRIVEETASQLGALHVLVNHIATQEVVESFEEITTEQWEETFRTNSTSFFWCTKAALKHIPEDGTGAIIDTASVNGLRGNKDLPDYSATKGAIIALTYSLAQMLVERKIRVNCVAPGPVWTPLIPSRGSSIAGQRSITTSRPAARARAAAASSTTPSCIHTAAAPCWIASSTCAPASADRRKMSTTSTGPSASTASASDG